MIHDVHSDYKDRTAIETEARNLLAKAGFDVVGVSHFLINGNPHTALRVCLSNEDYENVLRHVAESGVTGIHMNDLNFEFRRIGETKRGLRGGLYVGDEIVRVTLSQYIPCMTPVGAMLI